MKPQNNLQKLKQPLNEAETLLDNAVQCAELAEKWLNVFEMNKRKSATRAIYRGGRQAAGFVA